MRSLILKILKFLTNKSYLILSIIVLGLGSYLIIKDFHKEQVKIWDEASSAKNAIDMLANNNFLVQYDDGKVVRDDFKPPLSLWAKMLTYKIFGINEFAVRLPSIIAAILTMLMLWYYGSFKLRRPDIGILSALILVSSKGYVFYHVARTGDPDSMLVFFTALSAIALFQLYRLYPEKRNKYYIILGAALTLALFTKGIMGVASLAGAGLFLFIFRKGRRILLDYRLYISAGTALLLLGLYYIIRENLDPGYFEGVLKYEVFSFKEAPLFVKHPQFNFYFKYLENYGFNPFFYLIPVFVIVYFFIKDKLIKDLMSFSFISGIIFLLGMSFATLKNEWYISPVYPFLAIFVASGIAGLKGLLVSMLPEKMHNYINSLLLILLIILVYNPIKDIDIANHAYKNYVYFPEREGRFFDQIKTNYPEIMNINVITPHNIRQLQFYQKKYNYLDGTETKIYSSIHDELADSKVIACDNSKLTDLARKFKYDIIDFDEHCYLFEIIDIEPIQDSLVVFCDAESFSHDGLYFIDPEVPGFQFSAKGVTDKKSFSGINSILVNEENRYGLTTEFNLTKEHKALIVEVWVKNFKRTAFVATRIQDLNFYHQSNRITDNKGEWKKMILEVFIPPNYNRETIKVYVYNNSSNVLYFDDLKMTAF